MSIFVSIASFRDLELPKTVDSLISNADDPDSLHIGIVSQDLKNKHPKYDNSNIKVMEVDAKQAKGAGYARSLAMDLYDGEDYFFQIDSHSRFAKGWDTKLKNILKRSQGIAGTEKVILSQYPAPYFVGSDNKDYFPETGGTGYWSVPSWSKVINNAYGHWCAARQKMDDYNDPHLSYTVLAGYIFTLGSIVEEVPYDPRISFMGEELCFAVRAYTRGWEIYAPNEMLVYHFYKREGHSKIWNTGALKEKWLSMERESYAVQKDVLTGIEDGIYGIDDYERFIEYQEMVGIDFGEFYQMDRMNIKANLSVVEQEIDFSDTPMKSRYCLSDLHGHCVHIEECNCECHTRRLT